MTARKMPKPIRVWACCDNNGNLFSVYVGWTMPEIKELSFPKDNNRWVRVEIRPVRNGKKGGKK